MHGPIELRVAQSGTSSGTRRIVRIDGASDRSESLEIFFDLLDDFDVPPPQVLDGFVMGVLLYAMRLDQDIHVRGAMSVEALRNLRTFQEAWSMWRPDRYRTINIIPDQAVSHVPQDRESALAAFSGGVDSIFTILRHAGTHLDATGYPLSSDVLMVHGFDVPLREPEQLEKLQERTLPLIESLGLRIKTIRTNLKELNLQDWEDSFVTQLAACMHNYAHSHSVALVGSSEPYDALVLPWGSNPATDYLLSGSLMRLVHDGAGFSRTDKVERINRHSLATQVAKVCWEGKLKDRNCGRCEKCIRTRLNFLAVGNENPGCFDTPFDANLVQQIWLRNDAQCSELQSILDYATKRRMNQSWQPLLKNVVGRYRVRRRVQGLRTTLEGYASRVLPGQRRTPLESAAAP